MSIDENPTIKRESSEAVHLADLQSRDRAVLYIGRLSTAS